MIPAPTIVSGGGLAVVVARRPLVAVLVLAALAVLAFDLSLVMGSARLSLTTALPAVFGFGEPKDVFVVQKLRLARAVAALLTGAALGLAGALLQAMARNRLATPDTTGLTAGATTFAVWAILSLSFGGVAGPMLGPSVLSLVGAAVAVILALTLAGGTGAKGLRFVVVGIAIGEMFTSTTALLMARADMDAANSAYAWTIGSLNLKTGGPVAALAVALAVLILPVLALGRQLAVMRLGEAVGQSLGVRVALTRLLAVAAAVTLAALAISVAGPVGMVGLVAPELARRLAGPRGLPLVGAALAGALFVTVADLIGRTAFAPVEVPVGLVTAALGAPYLFALLLARPTQSNP